MTRRRLPVVPSMVTAFFNASSENPAVLVGFHSSINVLIASCPSDVAVSDRILSAKTMPPIRHPSCSFSEASSSLRPFSKRPAVAMEAEASSRKITVFASVSCLVSDGGVHFGPASRMMTAVRNARRRSSRRMSRRRLRPSCGICE